MKGIKSQINKFIRMRITIQYKGRLKRTLTPIYTWNALRYLYYAFNNHIIILFIVFKRDEKAVKINNPGKQL